MQRLAALAAARAQARSLLFAQGAAPGGLPACGDLDAAAARWLACLAAVPAGRPCDLAALRADHRVLEARLGGAGLQVPRSLRALEPRPAFAAQFDDGFEAVFGAGVLRGVRERAGVEATLAGVSGTSMTPPAAWLVAETILTSARQRPERPVVLVLDEGCSSVGMDESPLLSEYLVHLARTLAWSRAQAVAVNVWIVGDVSAATYLACASAASRVVAFPAAEVRLLGVADADRARAAALGATGGLVDEAAAHAGRVSIDWGVAR